MRSASLQPGNRGTHLTGFLIITVVGLRLALLNGPRMTPAYPLLAAFTILYAAEPWLARRIPWQRFVYFPLQTGILVALANLRPFTDISSALFVLLSFQALRAFPRRAAMGWLAAFAVLAGAALLRGMPWAEGIATFLVYLAVGGFFVSYDVLSARMRADEAESRELLAQLQAAHARLQQYAGEAEELAAARERNRLARELHDSVSQAIFSIQLTSQSARILLQRDPARVPEQVDRLQAMTAEALAQLRSLIAELHPTRE